MKASPAFATPAEVRRSVIDHEGIVRATDDPCYAHLIGECVWELSPQANLRLRPAVEAAIAAGEPRELFILTDKPEGPTVFYVTLTPVHGAVRVTYERVSPDRLRALSESLVAVAEDLSAAASRSAPATSPPPLVAPRAPRLRLVGSLLLMV